MSEQGTAVTTTAQDHPEVQAIRAAGQHQVALRDEIKKLTKQIEQGEWGAGSQMVKGSSLSPASRQALAEFCFHARANPYYHVDLFAGKPFLNEKYWSDRINSDERFVDYTFTNISEDDVQRKEWGVPEWATFAYLCTIRKLSNFAPMNLIRSGQLRDWERYVVTSQEANWAGNKPRAQKRDGGTYEADPIGNAEPSKTARTRALRRTAAKTFPVWCAAEDDRIRRLENALVAEFEVIASDRAEARASLPAEGERQAHRVGAGEPVAAKAEVGTREPAKGRGKQQQAAQQDAPVVYPVPTDPEAQEAEQRFVDGCEALGIADLVGFAQEKLGHLPESAEDFRTLSAELARIADA
jgi:hypothetical protein